MTMDLSDRWGSQKGHNETWYNFSQNVFFFFKSEPDDQEDPYV